MKEVRAIETADWRFVRRLLDWDSICERFGTMEIDADEMWDAGDLGCGELVLELRMRLARMSPGQIMKLVALDPGAPADVPAWCRMTGHSLVSGEHPIYLIRRKES